MKARVQGSLCFMLNLLLLLPTRAHAGDPFYRMMHNDQNVLALGEITQLDENECVVTVSECIVSKQGPSWRTHYTPERMVFELSNFSYMYVKELAQEGDLVLVSADRVKGSKDRYTIACGCYRVSSLDREVLTIVLPDTASESIKAIVTCIEWFLRSDGMYTEFFHDIDGNTWLRLDEDYESDNVIMIYPPQENE